MVLFFIRELLYIYITEGAFDLGCVEMRGGAGAMKIIAVLKGMQFLFRQRVEEKQEE